MDRRPPTLFLSMLSTEAERLNPPRKPTAFARSIKEDSSSGSVESSSE